MRTKVVTCLVVAAGVLGMASLALAQTNAPKSAKKFQASLVAAYNACTAPNNSTKTLPLPACDAVESDPSCDFQPGVGSGAVKAKVSGSTIVLSAKAKGINLACAGKTLAAVATVRATTNDCTTPPCTILEGVTKDFPTGCSGVVDASGGFSCSAVVGPGVLAPGANTDISNNGCALTDGGVHALDCGQFVP